MDSKISLVIPVFNESDEIENFFNDLKFCNFDLINEIIFIDDFSADDSSNLLEEKIDEFKKLFVNTNFLLLNNLKNRGYGFSIKKGINKSNNDSIAIIDLDRTYKIEDLNYIANQFINDYKLEYDLISGEREIDTTNTSRLKIIGKTIINSITNFCFDEKIVDSKTGLISLNKF